MITNRQNISAGAAQIDKKNYHSNFNNALHTKSAYMGGGDPEFATLLIKSILNK